MMDTTLHTEEQKRTHGNKERGREWREKERVREREKKWEKEGKKREAEKQREESEKRIDNSML